MFKIIQDPVCGMVIDPAKAVASITYKEKTYYFCTSNCKTVFENGPDEFVDQTDMSHNSSQGSVSGKNDDE